MQSLAPAQRGSFVLALLTLGLPVAQAQVAPAWQQELESAELSRRQSAFKQASQAPQLARQCIPILLRAMDDPDAEIRWRAELALGRAGQAGVPKIAEALRAPESTMRKHAAYVLGPMGAKAKAAVPDLLRTARDADADVRTWSVMALGSIEPRHPQVLPLLAGALSDSSADVRRVAVRVAIKLGAEAKEVIPALGRVLEDSEAELRWLACLAFRQIGPGAATEAPRLLRLLDDSDPDVRSRAAQALSRMGEAAEPLITAALEDPAPPIRAAARQILVDLRSRAAPAATTAATQAEPDAQAIERARWYREAKFGLFIHWGLYSVAHRARPGQLAEWVMANEKISVEEYEKLAQGFSATKFDPSAWVRLAQDTGARYLVLTSKHHDGFCLWDTPSTSYNAAKFAAAGRDLIAPLSLAAESAGLKLALYYSLLDWHHPQRENDFPKYVGWMHGQLSELLIRYPIWGLWFDGEWTHSKAEWRGDEIVARVRRLRPLAFVNDRLGRETRGTMAGVDFYTKEQEIPPATLRLQNRPVAWETCQTFGYSWGYNESPDPLRTGERLIEELVDVVSKGGNFLLNIGPRPDGTIPEYFQERMRIIGEFLKQNGEAIYGTEASPFGGPLPAGRVTTKGNRLYVFLEQAGSEGIVLPTLQSQPLQAWLLATGEKLAVRQKNGQPVIESPSALQEGPFTVVAVELSGPPVLLKP